MFIGEYASEIQLFELTRITSFIGVFGVYVFLVWHSLAKKNWHMFFVFSGGFLVSILSLYVTRYYIDIMRFSAGRHYFIPVVTMIWVFVLSESSLKYFRLIPLSMMLISFLFLTPSSKNQVLDDLDWDGNVSRCADQPFICQVPIHPLWEPPSWFVYIGSHEFSRPSVQHEVSSKVNENIKLVGFDLVQTVEEYEIKFVWRAIKKNDINYDNIFYIVNSDKPEKIIFTQKRLLLESLYPTSTWQPKEYLVDYVSFSIKNIPPGSYKIAIGWYDPKLTTHVNQVDFWKLHSVVLPISILIP